MADTVPCDDVIFVQGGFNHVPIFFVEIISFVLDFFQTCLHDASLVKIISGAVNGFQSGYFHTSLVVIILFSFYCPPAGGGLLLLVI